MWHDGAQVLAHVAAQLGAQVCRHVTHVPPQVRMQVWQVRAQVAAQVAAQVWMHVWHDGRHVMQVALCVGRQACRHVTTAVKASGCASAPGSGQALGNSVCACVQICCGTVGCGQALVGQHGAPGSGRLPSSEVQTDTGCVTTLHFSATPVMQAQSGACV